MVVDNENLSGLKELLSWFSNQYYNRKNGLTKNERLKVYEALPPPPQPTLTNLPTRWNKSTKRKIKETWETLLDPDERLLWEKLSPTEQSEYLFTTPEWKKVRIAIRSKRPKKQKSITDPTIKMIRKKHSRTSREKWWKGEDIDWDNT